MQRGHKRVVAVELLVNVVVELKEVVIRKVLFIIRRIVQMHIIARMRRGRRTRTRSAGSPFLAVRGLNSIC